MQYTEMLIIIVETTEWKYDKSMFDREMSRWTRQGEQTELVE